MQDKNKNKNRKNNTTDKNLNHLDRNTVNVAATGDLTGLIPGATMGLPDYELKSYKEMYGFGEGLEK